MRTSGIACESSEVAPPHHSSRAVSRGPSASPVWPCDVRTRGPSTRRRRQSLLLADHWSDADDLAALAASWAAIGIGVANFSCSDREVLARLRAPWCHVIGELEPFDRAAADLDPATRDLDHVVRPRRFPGAFALA
jgi:hypothetical protein